MLTCDAPDFWRLAHYTINMIRSNWEHRYFTDPALAHLYTTKNRLVAFSTNRYVALWYAIPATIEEPMDLTINVDQLDEFVREAKLISVTGSLKLQWYAGLIGALEDESTDLVEADLVDPDNPAWIVRSHLEVLDPIVPGDYSPGFDTLNLRLLPSGFAVFTQQEKGKPVEFVGDDWRALVMPTKELSPGSRYDDFLYQNQN